MSLVHLDLAAELPVFFDGVRVPSAVQKEVNRKQRFRYRLNKLYRTGFFSRCKTADETNVQLLRHEKELDEGEAEALIQAQETAATFFIGDEKRARSIAENLGLTCIGTIRLIARLHLEGRARDPRALVQKLRRNRRFRVSEEIIENAFAAASEPI
jgi:predicted nucleic acid-binding protein